MQLEGKEEETQIESTAIIATAVSAPLVKVSLSFDTLEIFYQTILCKIRLCEYSTSSALKIPTKTKHAKS